MTEQNAQLAHVAFQRPDGSTGVMDIHDEHAIPNEPDVIDSENLVSGAVINGKVAPDAITEVELADGAVTKDKLSPEMQEDWDSLCHGKIEGVSLTADFGGWRDVVFPRTYLTPPTVIVAIEHSGGLNRNAFPVVRMGTVTTKGFRCIVHSNGYAVDVTIHWIAIG